MVLQVNSTAGRHRVADHGLVRVLQLWHGLMHVLAVDGLLLAEMCWG